MINLSARSKFYFSVMLLLVATTKTVLAADYLPKEDFIKNALNAKDAHAYFGIEAGYGQASGTAFPLNSGFVYGATAGVEVLKTMGIGLTYQHSGLNYLDSGVHNSIHQILFEVNAFSLLILNGGIHIGDIIRIADGVRTADLGFGIHAGFDAGITEHVTVGLVGYTTFVFEREDHHTLLNLLVPVKYWF